MEASEVDKITLHKIKRIVFWQNIISHLQIPFIREIAHIFDGEVIIVVPEELTQSRQKLGWKRICTLPAKKIVNPSIVDIVQMIRINSESNLHVFSGISAYLFVKRAFLESLKVTTYRAIISETYRDIGLKGLVRLMRGKRECMLFSKYINIIYAIGNNGCTWFKKCGYPVEIIQKFAYYPDITEYIGSSTKKRDNYVITFIGQLIHRKGIDILVKALAKLKNYKWELDLIGDGGEKANLLMLVKKLGIDKQVNFLGTISNEDIYRNLSEADVLILPSRWDGWGAVVNEALLSGVPVICSSRCGASDLIKDSDVGDVFVSESVMDLKKRIEQRLLTGKTTSNSRDEIKAWSQKIQSKNGAVIFLKRVGTI